MGIQSVHKKLQVFALQVFPYVWTFAVITYPLPLTRKINTVSIGTLLVLSFIIGNPMERFKQLFSSKLFLFCLAYYLWALMANLVNLPEASPAYGADVKRWFLIVPAIIVWSSSIPDFKTYIKPLLLAYAASCSLVVIDLYLWAFDNILRGNTFGTAFLGQSLVDKYGPASRTFLGMDMLPALIALLWINLPKNLHFLRALGLMVIGSFLLLISARMVLAIAFLQFITWLIFNTHIKRAHKLITFGAFTASMVLLFSFNAYFRNSVSMLFKGPSITKDSSINMSDGSSVRLVLWQTALEMIKDRPAFGYGTKAQDKVLNLKLTEKGFNNLSYHNLYVHNTYLDFAIESGVLAALMLLAAIAWLFKESLKAKNYTFAAYLIGLAMFCISECYFRAVLHNYIIFILLFSALIYYLPIKESHSEPRTSE